MIELRFYLRISLSSDLNAGQVAQGQQRALERAAAAQLNAIYLSREGKRAAEAPLASGPALPAGLSRSIRFALAFPSAFHLRCLSHYFALLCRASNRQKEPIREKERKRERAGCLGGAQVKGFMGMGQKSAAHASRRPLLVGLPCSPACLPVCLPQQQRRRRRQFLADGRSAAACWMPDLAALLGPPICAGHSREPAASRESLSLSLPQPSEGR